MRLSSHPNIAPTLMTNKNYVRYDNEIAVRTVLVTNGLRPILSRFMSLNGHKIGVVSWYGEPSGRLLDTMSAFDLIARIYARLRNRQYASLAHYCRINNLRYIRFHKSQTQELQKILTQWQTDLVITSGCPLIPMDVLRGVRFGGINLHPSALPSYRGADPLAWQVLDQVDRLGACVHRLRERCDTGPILVSTNLARPLGVCRDTLTQQLEGELGYVLLNKAIQKIASQQDTEDQEQPTQSPTQAASKLSVHSVGERWPLGDLSALLVWDVISFYNRCPPRWLAVTGWRRLVKWTPVSFNFITGHDFHRQSSRWHVKQVGLCILLVSQVAVIKLKPAF